MEYMEKNEFYLYFWHVSSHFYKTYKYKFT